MLANYGPLLSACCLNDFANSDAAYKIDVSYIAIAGLFCAQVVSMTLPTLILFAFIETLCTYMTFTDGECSQKPCIVFFFALALNLEDGMS